MDNSSLAKNMRELLIKIPTAIPKELNPNWWPKNITDAAIRGLKARAIGHLHEFTLVYAMDARNRWERVNGQKWEALPGARLEATIILPPRAKRWDSTNIRSALKYAEDCLVRTEIIVDDSPEHVEWAEMKFARGPEPEIWLKIQEVEHEQGTVKGRMERDERDA